MEVIILKEHFKIGDFVIFKDYTKIEYLGKIVRTKNNRTIYEVEICTELINGKYKTELVDAEPNQLTIVRP